MKTSVALLAVLLAAAASGGAPKAPTHDPREAHLADLAQLTSGGENAEAYWSPDGRELVFQSTRPPWECDQILRMPAGGGEAALVSTGKGRTTCAYFTADAKRVVYSSTHQAGADCPPPPDRSQGYVWPIDGNFEIWSARPDGGDLVRLTDNTAYDAETTVCPVDGSLLFTSSRDGDLELYRMDADGKNVRRLTNVPGYDGGAFFSPDCSRIVWRASRPKEGPEMEDYRRLLGQGLIRPTKLEIWVANADGSEARQITYLDAASFAPSFFPDGKRVIFSSNYGDPKGREFELWAVDVDGTDLERITWSAGFDGFPLFAPDGKRLVFASNRDQGAPGETNIFVARWVDGPIKAEAGAAERYRDDVRWLADDAREGRGVGTAGLEAASQWIAARMAELGVQPAGSNGTYFQAFDVPVAVEVAPGTAVAVDGEPLAAADFVPLSFSAQGEVGGEVVAAGYGITATDLGVDDYHDVDAHGKVVAVRRFVPAGPAGGAFANKDNELRYGDLRYKAWNAREHGAIGMIVVDLPADAELGQEAPLPALAVDSAVGAGGDAGIAAVALKRSAGAKLFAAVGHGHQASLKIDLIRRTKPARNVVGLLPARANPGLPGAVLVGAHYDHLGLGGAGSLAPDSKEPHNGADDNASGTAALLEVARELAARPLERTVWLVAFSGEESGVLGSTALIRHPPAGLKLDELAGMLNMDMVGRLRGNVVAVLGGESANEWGSVVPAACERQRLQCTLSGDGYGPSDHSPFYAAGVPVLHFFTGAHSDYHKPSDDAAAINSIGGARIAALVADVAGEIANRKDRLTYKAAPAPAPRGDQRSFGASLGTIPDYAGDGRPGVLLSGVRPGSAAETAGIKRGDLLIELSGTEIRDINDFMFVLRKSKPGETTTAVVDRGGEKVTVTVTFGGRAAPM